MSIVPREETPKELLVTHVPRGAMVMLTVTFALAIFFFAIIVAFPYLHLHRGPFRLAARWIPFPAMVVDGDIVWYREIAERANALSLLAGLNEDEAIAQAIVLAKQRAVLMALADELEVRVTDGELAELMASGSALAQLRSGAAWTVRDYRRLGVRVYLLAERVEAVALTNTDAQRQARARLERIEEKYRQGIPFANLATQYSEGMLATAAGDMGYVDPATLPDALAVFARTATAGEVSSILESGDAFWLLKAEDVQITDDGQRQVWLRAIEVKKDLLADVLQVREDEATVIQFLR